MDKWLKKVGLYQKACAPDIQQQAMEKAGEVLATSLLTATPTGKTYHGKWKPPRGPGNARASIVNLAGKMRTYGISRRLIGYSKKAPYMLWVLKGHKLVTGGRLARKTSRNGRTHSQSGKGRVVGQVQGRDFMSTVFKSNIDKAQEAYRQFLQQFVRRAS